MSTKIEWCVNSDGTQGEVWNCVTGCTPAGAGCAHCYAASIARRFWKGRKFSDVRCHPERLDLPRYWKKPRMVFVNSMSDLFHEAVPESFILQVMNIIQQCSQHTFVVLTKRPERMQGLSCYPPIPNLWLGVSAENQEAWNKRVPVLLSIPAAKHFVSCEPLLGQINMLETQTLARMKGLPATRAWQPVDWLLVGAEQGPGARHMNLEWANYLKRQCACSGTPFFFKKASAGESFPDLTAAREFPINYLQKKESVVI